LFIFYIAEHKNSDGGTMYGIAAEPNSRHLTVQ